MATRQCKCGNQIKARGAQQCGACYRKRPSRPTDYGQCACGTKLSGRQFTQCATCYRNRGQAPADKKVDYGTCQFCPAKLNRHGQKVCGDCHNKHRTELTPDLPAPKLNESTMAVKGDTAEVWKRTPDPVRTLADLIRICEIDTTEWIIDRWVANKWEVGTKDAHGEVHTTPLYQIKAWLTRNRPMIEAREEIAALIADAKKQIAPRPSVKRSATGPHMLEIAIPDLHLGKLAWAPETGGANYDSKIAVDLYLAALEALILRTAAFKFEQVVLPLGQDFFHSDSKQGATTKGTPLDTDSRYHKMFQVGRRLMTDAIERLRQIAPVSVVVVPGNHDALAAYHLADSLDCLYHKTPDVEVRNEPIPRKYVSYGRNLIMYTHSDKGKKQNYPLLMATERPDLFGKARYREAHVGHTHELKVQEHMGVRVRVSPALCSADAWHSENHFVGNLRSAEALVWSREEGNIATATYTVIEDDAERKAS